ncbi:hypothetical protein AKO1_003941, partial [Acrasis kona]
MDIRIHDLVHKRISQLFQYIPNTLGYLIGYYNPNTSTTSKSCTDGEVIITDEDIAEVYSIIPAGLSIIGVYFSNSRLNGLNTTSWWKKNSERFRTISRYSKSGFVVVTGNETKFYVQKDNNELKEGKHESFNVIKILPLKSITKNIDADQECFYLIHSQLQLKGADKSEVQVIKSGSN